MDEIRNAVLIAIRKGDPVMLIQEYLHDIICDLSLAKDYDEKPSNVALFAQAIKDAKFRP